MAYPALMKPDFNTGVLDAPDLNTRMAAMKVQLGQPLGQDELRRLAQRQWVEGQPNTAVRGPGGAVDMMTPRADFNGVALPPAPDSAPNTPAPGASVPGYAPRPLAVRGAPPSGSVMSMLQGTRLDTEAQGLARTAQIEDVMARTQNRQITGQMHVAQMQEHQARMQQTQLERTAIAAAYAPGVADPEAAYVGAGGANPATLNTLRRERPFTPTFAPAENMGGPAGSYVFQETPHSARVVEPRQDKPSYPRTIDAGGRKLIEVSAGKFTDEAGKPVEWRDTERPLSVNEFLMSPQLVTRFDGDYSAYRDAFTKAAGTDKPAAAGDGKGAAPAAKIVYKHEDVLAEMKRRGLAK